jgi:hypothetical protein
MAYRTLEESNFGGGVVKEIPPWLLPPGTLADASNLIFDEPGIARQRNGSTALSSPTTTAFSSALGWVYSADVTPIEELYGMRGSANQLFVINKTTGASTAVVNNGAQPVQAGRPIRHFGFGIFPFSGGGAPNVRSAYLVAGETTNTSFVSTAAVTVTAGTPTITLGGTDTTTNVKVGGVVNIIGAGAVYEYWGRVVSITDSTHFVVVPTPTITFTSTALGCHTDATVQTFAGSCVASFQNRLLCGNTIDFSTYATGSFSQIADRRVNYSVLPTETGINPIGNVIETGYSFVVPFRNALLNYFEVPGADPIVSMEPISDNELLILTTQGVVIFRGTLATQTTTSAPGITFDISPLNTNAGCLQDLSVQKTPHGVIWASAEGVMLYTGGGRSPIDLTAGKMHTYWRNLTRGSNFVVHGAYYARNHYVVSGASGGSTFSLAYNMDNQTWGPLTGAGTDTFNGAPRPTDPSQVYVGRWWDVTGGAPTQTGGHVIRVDSVFAPDVVGQTKTDADGSVVAFSGKTRTITGDQELERILRRLGVRAELEAFPASGTAAVNVSVGARLDSAETGGTPTVNVGAFSNTSVLTVNSATNASPIVITTSANHGLQTEDWVDIRSVLSNTAANGRWMITVLSNTTFSLMGSTGNGASTPSGTCKRTTESEYSAQSADIGQGHWVNFASNGTVNRFKLHGVRMGAMMFDRGMTMSRG